MMKKILSLKSYQMMHRIGVTVVAAISMAGCASTPHLQKDIIARAAIAMQAAPEQRVCTTTAQSAMEKMDIAEQAMSDKDYVVPGNSRNKHR